MASVFTRRIIAYILDFFVVSAFMWIVSYACYIYMGPNNVYTVYKYFPYVVPALIFIYFVICERLASATIGKSLMYLEVRSRNGAKINWAQAIVRNLTKIFWFPIIFDWAIGKILMRRDRLFAVITKTVVINDVN